MFCNEKPAKNDKNKKDFGLARKRLIFKLKFDKITPCIV